MLNCLHAGFALGEACTPGKLSRILRRSLDPRPARKVGANKNDTAAGRCGLQLDGNFNSRMEALAL